MNLEKTMKYKWQYPNHKNQLIDCVDLFCGAGGLTHGLIRSGINVTVGIDIDTSCKFPYESNNKNRFIEKNVKDLTSKEVSSFFSNSKIRLLAGCAPCQPFSTYSRNRNKDEKWGLVADFGKLVKEISPELVTMENVPQITQHEIFHILLDYLDGYNIWWDIVDCTQYGIPQTRKRLVLLASKMGKIKLCSADELGLNKIVTVRQAISLLPAIKAGEFYKNDPLHSSSSLSQLNTSRIRASKPGGTWRDWDVSLRAKCHRKESGRFYSGVYARMEWDKPSPTITTQFHGFGNGRFGHPSQDRAISLREGAILQTFPKDYKFINKDEKPVFNKLARLIGNAVPVQLAEVIGRSFVIHLNDKIT